MGPVQAKDRKHDIPLLTAACLALIIAIVRACLQSVTLDEAESYLLFATPDWPAHWYASSGNHVLNTILERLFVTVFGLSHLTLRAPALIGGAVYIASSYGLARGIAWERKIRWPLFVCLVYNPFVMDYLVAARGYGLALGFLMAAIWAASESRFATASICAGLSFCANFPFAYIDAALILVFAAREWRYRKDWRTAARCLIPGAVVAFLICGATLWSWPKGQLYYGAQHLRQMWESLVASTFDDPNPFMVHPLLAPVLEALRPLLPWLLIAVLIWQTLRIIRAEQPLGLILARATAIAFLCHWLAFRLMRIPLPMERTAIFFVPLAILLIGIGAALPSGLRIASLHRPLSMAALSLCAVYFAGCLRLSYFKEWRFAAETKQVFEILSDVRRSHDVREIGTEWRYSSSLNFYSECFHVPRFVMVSWKNPAVGPKPVYVMYAPEAKSFVEDQKLRVVYYGKVSDVIVAVRWQPDTQLP